MEHNRRYILKNVGNCTGPAAAEIRFCSSEEHIKEKVFLQLMGFIDY